MLLGACLPPEGTRDALYVSKLVSCGLLNLLCQCFMLVCKQGPVLLRKLALKLYVGNKSSKG